MKPNNYLCPRRYVCDRCDTQHQIDSQSYCFAASSAIWAKGKLMDKNKDRGIDLLNTRVSMAIRNIREGISLKKKYGITPTSKEKTIIGDK